MELAYMSSNNLFPNYRRFTASHFQKWTASDALAAGHALSTGRWRTQKRAKQWLSRWRVSRHSRVTGMFFTGRWGRFTIPRLLQRQQGHEPFGFRIEFGTATVFETGTEEHAAGCHTARSISWNAIICPLPHLPKGIQAKKHTITTWLHTYWIAAISMSGMWEAIQTTITFDTAFTHTYEWKTIRMYILSSIL